MKKIFLAILLFFVCAHIFAQDDQINLNSKITNVTVFRSGAQVQRQTDNIDLPQGVSLIVFPALSSAITAQSIQAKGEGDFTILAVTQQQNFLSEKVNSVQITSYRSKIEELNDKIIVLKNESEVYKQEEEMLIKNQTVTGPNLNYDLVKLKLALDFQKQRLLEAKNKQLTINKELNGLQLELNKYNQQISELSGRSYTNSNDVVIKVAVKSATKGKFSLTYMVNNAGWFPSYDIRAKDIASPIELVYKANVFQSSGEDWKNIKLILSSGNPTSNQSKPYLLPYSLGFRDNFYDKKKENELNEVVVMNALQGKAAGIKIRGNSSLASVPLDVNTIEKQTNTVFDIKIPYSILSDGKQFAVEIGNYNFKADYEYYAAPKLREEAFLTAKINGFNEANLIEGEANIFFDGTYLGKTVLDIKDTSDTLTISLGIDKNVIIKREKQKDFNERQFIGSSQKDSRSFVIDIKNRKSQAINLTIEDQLPISTSSDITVDRQEVTKAEVNESTGVLTWKMVLQPNEQKKLNLKFQVKYPKNRPINLE